jgi:hypothetical protein
LRTGTHLHNAKSMAATDKYFALFIHKYQLLHTSFAHHSINATNLVSYIPARCNQARNQSWESVLPLSESSLSPLCFFSWLQWLTSLQSPVSAQPARSRLRISQHACRAVPQPELRALLLVPGVHHNSHFACLTAVSTC